MRLRQERVAGVSKGAEVVVDVNYRRLKAERLVLNALLCQEKGMSSCSLEPMFSNSRLKEGTRAMSFFCPHCDIENAAGYAWRGMTIRCPACLREITLQYRNGQSIPVQGYELTFHDFCQLVEDSYNRSVTHPAIAKLLNCTVALFDGRFVLQQSDGALIPLEAAHFLLQSDPTKQRDLYNTAMSVWR